MNAKYTSAVAALHLIIAASAYGAADIRVYSDEVRANVDPGARITKRFGVQNAGPDAAVVRLTVALPAGARLLGWSDGWACAQGSDAITCTRALPNGGIEWAALTIAAPDDPAGVAFVGDVHAESNQPDPVPDNNSVTTAITVYHLMTVATPDDFGAGSLRDALHHANAECVGAPPCKIRFAEPMRIAPRSPLPVVTACNLLIDGGGYRGDTRNRSFDAPRRVDISGEEAGAADGLVVASACGFSGDAPILQGLAVHSFTGSGISVVDPAEPGLSVVGCSVVGNFRGISIDAPKAVANVTDCLVADNARSGIAYWRSLGGLLLGNLIGVGFGGVPMPNGASGVYVNGGWVNTFGNAIEYNNDFGVAVGPGATHFIAHDDYIALNGGIAIDWGLDGPTAVDRSGRMPPVPRLLDAFYDPAQKRTIIKGVIPMDESTPQNFYAVVASLADGDFQGGVPAVPGTPLLAAQKSDLPFQFFVLGDHRGRTITARTIRQVYSDFEPVDTSEFSAAIVVR